MDPNEEERILQLLREVPSEHDCKDDQFNSDIQDSLEESEHNSESEQSGDEFNQDVPPRRHHQEVPDPASPPPLRQGSPLPQAAVP